MLCKINSLKSQNAAPSASKHARGPGKTTPTAVQGPPSKKVAGKRSRTEDTKQQSTHRQSGQPKVTRLSVERQNGADHLFATIQFGDGKTNQLNDVKNARNEYAQEMVDFLLSKIRFTHPARVS
eukprot:GHVN01103181.1.p1 GENE.GHVN01103181.1~~GHVN01103181.1.p1  ORF type:complete len:124 (+),score=12.14 GHVN01103181.1:246-617(+)